MVARVLHGLFYDVFTDKASDQLNERELFAKDNGSRVREVCCRDKFLDSEDRGRPVRKIEKIGDIDDTCGHREARVKARRSCRWLLERPGGRRGAAWENKMHRRAECFEGLEESLVAHATAAGLPGQKSSSEDWRHQTNTPLECRVYFTIEFYYDTRFRLESVKSRFPVVSIGFRLEPSVSQDNRDVVQDMVHEVVYNVVQDVIHDVVMD
ncbi:hypothetical protein WN48_07258 [Eufriesea mexicana]|uniref:Uncharacterized protein n=1 Tax=Eufriesea mexicana TaxID=516756 RepID=A0A310SHJ4_9HYME|nr:hypothetical protein WN48_07258 [Eufriesea mexicana]